MYVLRNLVKLNCCSLPWKSITVLWGYLIMFDSDFRVFTFVTANYSELGFARWMLPCSAFYIHYVMTKRLWYKSQFGVMSWLHHFPGTLVASRVNLRAGDSTSGWLFRCQISLLELAPRKSWSFYCSWIKSLGISIKNQFDWLFP